MSDNLQCDFIWYELMTSDLDQAVAFYRDVVGWEIRDSGMPGPMRYMLFGKGGKDVGGMCAWADTGQPGKPPAWMGHIYTPDIDAEVAAVEADGGKVWRQPQEIPGVGRFAVMSDPQGGGYLLFQPHGSERPPRLTSAEPGAIGWKELNTTDWEKAWAFYSKHYGWTKGTAVDMGAMGTYQTFMLGADSGGGMMNIPAQFADRVPGPSWLFYITVEDIQAAAQRVADAGGKIVHGPAQVPGGSWVLQGIDPQGARFALTAGNVEHGV